MTKITTATHSRLVVTIGLCFMVALMEGLDLQAAGIAAVGMAQAFALDKMQMGWIFSAGILGLLPGALVGGMLADRHGRKRILLGSVLLFGLFSLATALAWSFPTLLLARLLTGVGLGAALPNLIALTSEAAGSRFRGRAVSLMYCGVPIGAALAAALGFSGLAAAWQTIFCPAAADPVADALAAGVAGVSARGGQRAAAHPVCPGPGRRYAAVVAGLFFHPAGGLYADQLAADAAGGPGIPRQPGGGGDVLSADRRRLRHAAAGGANG
ncbi:MFS transporter [Klebsiella pneumoniae]|nr:MFS transporter [Klebsiella pneumoniae]MDK8118806.1 MFS transporter [Klebsiella pneumoniae]